MLKKELLEILCCPRCKGELDYRAKEDLLVCKKCKHRYEVQNDIPVMLVNDDK